MPTKAESVSNNSNSLMSRASSLLNINHTNVTYHHPNTNGNNNHSRANKANNNHGTTSNNHSNHQANPAGNNNQSALVSNEKFSRIDGGEQQIIVACRIRPLTEEEIIEGSSIIGHKIADDNMIVLMDPAEDPDDILRANRSRERQFVFDMVFDAKSTQQDVYEKTTKPLLSGVLNGYNATVFAYGATGAGKTYTMLGTEEEPGTMFRTLHELFIEISNTQDLTYQVSMSYLEIYNELIRDLLSPASGFLELREDAKGGVQVAGISEQVAETPQEVMYLLHKGNKERTQEPTKANKTSSRSHAVLQVNIKQRNKIRQQSQEIRLGKLYMIDLAGSERAAQTQNTGKRMVEGAHINRSLLALGNCINALSEKGSTKYVNYRDSKLTRILKDSLGGNSKTVMIAHISPASIHFEESRNTLVYADRAKYIRTKIRRNVIDVSYHITQYQQIIQELAQEIATLKEQRNDLESRISHLDPRAGSIHGEDKSKMEEALKLRESLLLAFKQQITLRKNILELDNAIMDISIEADRHNKIIEGWEAHKENNSNQKYEHSAAQVHNAREELKVVEADREELETKRKDTMKEYEALKQRTKKLRDIAAKKLNTQEQKEILNLLLKNFEFEIKNIEMQADIFKRDFKLREQDMVILRLEQHRSLCDTLIYQQRRLIVENNLNIPSDLNELYFLYSRDVNDGQLMKDLSGVRSTSSNSSLNTNSPKPNVNAFLTQIQEEGGDGPSPLVMYDKQNNWKKNNMQQQNAMNNNNNNNNKNSKRGFQTQQNNMNYATGASYGNGNGSMPNLLAPQNAFYRDNKNNSSMLSSSTNDSNMEIIIENNNSSNNNKQLAGIRQHGKNGVLTSNNFLTNPNIIIPPGQVVPSYNFSNTNGNSINSFSNGGLRNSNSMNFNTSGNYNNNNANQGTNSNAKRLTQNIAAIAAQRKATQHHRDLMQELGQNNPTNGPIYSYGNDGLTASRLARHDQNTGANNRIDDFMPLEKKNSVLTDGSLSNNYYTSNNNSNGGKSKKQVKIKDIVHFKLPDDQYPMLDATNNNNNNNNGNSKSHRRAGSDSPESKRSDEYLNKNNKKSNKNNRSKSNQNGQPGGKQSNFNSNNLNGINLMTGSNQANMNNTKSNVNSNQKVTPTIPNYIKGINMSVSGTSVLKS